MLVGGGGWFVVGGGPSVGGRAGWSAMGGDSSVAGGAGFSVVGGGSSVAEGVVEGSSTAGGSPTVGDGLSAAGGSGGAGSLVAGVGSSTSAGGAVSPVLLLGELLVPLGGNDSREGSRIACGAEDSFVVGDENLSCAAVAPVLGVGRATGTGAGPALADRSVAISRSLSPAHGILEPAAATPWRALLSTVSSSPPISATTCSTTTSKGWPMGLSESGANQERSETAITAAATTPTPASTYPRLARPRRRTRPMRAARRAGALRPRPSSSSCSCCLRTSCFSMGFAA
jgi:hypothetical protein